MESASLALEVKKANAKAVKYREEMQVERMNGGLQEVTKEKEDILAQTISGLDTEQNMQVASSQKQLKNLRAIIQACSISDSSSTQSCGTFICVDGPNVLEV